MYWKWYVCIFISMSTYVCVCKLLSSVKGEGERRVESPGVMESKSHVKG